jgi:hypothetical protein
MPGGIMKKKLVIFFVASVLLIGLLPGQARPQSEQAKINVYNNTPFAISFFVDDEDGYRCRIVVQYGYDNFYVSPGSHVLVAKTDDGTEAANRTIDCEEGHTYEWTIIWEIKQE